MNPVVVQLHPDIPVFPTPRKAAKILGLGEKTVYEALDRSRNQMPHIIVGSHKRVDLPQAIAWLEGGNL